MMCGNRQGLRLGAGICVLAGVLWLVPGVARGAPMLTEREEAYLLSHGPIRMCVDPDWMPFEKIDADGRHVGMVADYMDLVRQRLEWPIVLVPTGSWTETLNFAGNGTCDIVSALNKTDERSRYLTFTRSYLSAPNVVITRRDAPPIEDLRGLDGRPLGVTHNYATAKRLRDAYPDLEMVEFETMGKGLESVARGDTFAFFGSLFLIVDAMQSAQLSNLKVALNTDFVTSLRIGVRKDRPPLRELLDRILAGVRTDEHIAIQRAWLVTRFETPADRDRMLRVAVVALLVVGGVVLWNRRLAGLNTRLKREVVLRNETEHRLQSVNAELNRSNQELEQFAYAVSHDLQEPLRMVLGYLELLDRRARDSLSGDARDYLNFAVDGGRRASALIRGLLEYSRAGTREAALETLPLSGPIGEALSNLAMAIDERRARIAVPEDLPSVIGDRNQLVRVFQNIIGNALRYARPGVPPEIRIEAAVGDGLCTCSVIDNGRGIEPLNFERIFQIFQRLDEESEGIGMGLAVVKRIVERYGGQVWVESVPGEGSAFRFTLPLAG